MNISREYGAMICKHCLCHNNIAVDFDNHCKALKKSVKLISNMYIDYCRDAKLVSFNQINDFGNKYKDTIIQNLHDCELTCFILTPTNS